MQSDATLQYSVAVVYVALFLVVTCGVDLRVWRWGKAEEGSCRASMWAGLAGSAWGMVWLGSTVLAFPLFEKLLLPFQDKRPACLPLALAQPCTQPPLTPPGGCPLWQCGLQDPGRQRVEGLICEVNPET